MKISSIFLFVFLNLAVVGGLYAQATANSFVDDKNGFRVKYPSDFKVLVGAQAKLETAFGDPGKGVKLVKVTPVRIPNKYHGEYEFNVWRARAGRMKCGVPSADEGEGVPIEPPSEGTPKTRMIGGHIFFAYAGSDAGMSKSILIVGYRGRVNNQCWQIQSVTYQVSAFDDFKSFDDKIIQNSFEEFVKSFKFRR